GGSEPVPALAARSPAPPARRPSRAALSAARLRQLAHADVAELDGRSFGLEAQESHPRVGVAATRHFPAVHPQANLAVDAAHVVVVPLARAPAALGTRKAARAIGRKRRERLELRVADGEDVAVGREPAVGLAA